MADRLPNFSSLHQLQTVPDAVLEQMGWHKSKLFSNTLYWPPSSDRPSLSATHRRERSPLWLCRFDPITNHESPIRRASLAQGGPLTFHFSPFTNIPSSSHFSPLTAALAAWRYRPPFELRAADLRILGSGSVNASQRLFRVYDKEMANWRSNS